MELDIFLKAVVQRGEAEKNAKKLLTKRNQGGIITELSGKRTNKSSEEKN